MAHNVKCLWCGEIFDCELEQSVKARTNRYGHLKCVPQGEEYPLVPLPSPEELAARQTKAKPKRKKTVQKKTKDKELQELENYILTLFKVKYVPPRIQKQIKQYHEEYNYTYSGIQKSLFYFFEIQKHPVDTYGATIGIVPYVYDSAKQYFYTLFLARMANQSLKKEQLKTKVVEYQIPAPRHKDRKIKMFKIEEDE